MDERVVILAAVLALYFGHDGRFEDGFALLVGAHFLGVDHFHDILFAILLPFDQVNHPKTARP